VVFPELGNSSTLVHRGAASFLRSRTYNSQSGRSLYVGDAATTHTRQCEEGQRTPRVVATTVCVAPSARGCPPRGMLRSSLTCSRLHSQRGNARVASAETRVGGERSRRRGDPHSRCAACVMRWAVAQFAEKEVVRKLHPG